MTYITEEEVIAMFTVVEDRGARFVYRDKVGDYYIREGNFVILVSTTYKEGVEQPNLEPYVIRTKNDIVKDILNDL